jgi:GMP synthase PP-ATPase subunit
VLLADLHFALGTELFETLMGKSLNEGKRKLINIFYERRVKEQLQRLEAAQLQAQCTERPDRTDKLNETRQSISSGSTNVKRRGRGDRKRI